MPTQEGTVSLYIRIPPALKHRLQEYADRNDVSMNDVVIVAVGDLLDAHDPPEMKPRGK